MTPETSQFFDQSDVTIFAPIDAAVTSAIGTLVQDLDSLPTVLAGHVVSGSYKADMQAWLIEHDIDFEPDATRPKLWEIIKEELKNFPEY